ncbi:MAG: hypothetical protein J6N99_04965, partial [Schwartzia sp.]|nr:hypothetical protein [Schwartzia sp. (in: firmicutes)]
FSFPLKKMLSFNVAKRQGYVKKNENLQKSFIILPPFLVAAFIVPYNTIEERMLRIWPLRSSENSWLMRSGSRKAEPFM